MNKLHADFLNKDQYPRGEVRYFSRIEQPLKVITDCGEKCTY